MKRTPNLFVESSIMYSGYVRRAVREISPERVIMGTDTPTEVFEVQLKKIEMALEDPTERALVMGGNIARLLQLAAAAPDVPVTAAHRTPQPKRQAQAH